LTCKCPRKDSNLEPTDSESVACQLS